MDVVSANVFFFFFSLRTERQNITHFDDESHKPTTVETDNFYFCTVHYGIYILSTHQQMHFLLHLEKFKFT